MLSHRIFGEFMQRSYCPGIRNHKPFYNTQTGGRLVCKNRIFSLMASAVAGFFCVQSSCPYRNFLRLSALLPCKNTN